MKESLTMQVLETKQSVIFYCFYSSDVSMGLQSKMAYVKFEEASDVGVALHLTNTVFIDRAIIVVPVADGMYAFSNSNLVGFFSPGVNLQMVHVEMSYSDYKYV